MKLAIVGCGAVTRIFHLPACLRSGRFRLVALIDKDLGHAEKLAAGLQGVDVFPTHQDIPDDVDAAVVATPNRLHAPVAADLLNRGVHVLVEKPMALSSADCRNLSEIALSSRSTLAVGLVWRFYSGPRFLKSLMAAGCIGRIQKVDFSEGVPFAWPIESDAMFRKEDSGGGVLMDLGSHVLDMMQWCFGMPEIVSCRDDAHGGVDANCEIELVFPGDIPGRVELSRTRRLRNTLMVQGEQCTVEITPEPESRCVILPTGGGVRLTGQGLPAKGRKENLYKDPFVEQFNDFADAIETNREPTVSGLEGMRSVECIERCLEIREPLELPWVDDCTSGPEQVGSASQDVSKG